VALTEQAKGGLNSDKNGDMVGSVSSPTTDFFAQGNAADRNAPAPIVQADMKKEKIAPASAAAEPQKPLSSNTSSKSSSSSSRAQSDMRSLGTAISELGAGQSANTAASQQSASGLKQLLAQQEGNGTNQQAKSINEYQMRQISMSNMNTVAQSGAQVQNATMPVSVEKDSLKSDTESPDVREGGMRAFWSGDSLLLVRRVTLGNQTYLQGCSLDWPEVRKCLLNSIRDLLPQASLLPMESTPAQNGSRLLAALPVRLQPGHLPSQVSTPTLHPIQFALIITWVGLGVAAIAVALLLAGILSLSERRATFVSAVTHELRTPLTTLRMYSEMLSEGRVRSEEKIAHYHRTINTEAGRLAHLVENVLSYARLERGHPGNRAETADLPCFLERIGERLVDRAHQVGMELSIEMTPVAQTAAIHANLSSVEQILFNLVDNTCKYAVSADDKRICLNVDASEYVATLSVRDFGPGIDAKESRRLFRAFHKSAHDAAHSAPGVGLGLALSRRLARAMRGDLRHDASTQPGACFILTLPRVPR
ncbi:TPA: hypothetical protein DDW35_11895, partial [Candidatus Sumerlaeota bacterium]|nr:hypothetical protein [Candidatus Sumerlaeota bacterium]